MTARLVRELPVTETEASFDVHRHEVILRDAAGSTWGTTPAVLRHFEISNQRLSTIAGRRDFPEDAKRTLQGRVFWNLSEIERYLLSARRLSGPLPRYVTSLAAAGKITIGDR
jgi:hypothetical protein